MPAPVQRLPRRALTGTIISPVISPMPTALALIGGALTDRCRASAPPQIRRDLLSHLRRRDIAALLPISGSERQDGSGGRPNEIVPATPGASIEEELDAVRALDPGRLAQGIDAAHNAGHPARGWLPVAREPSRWLRAYADALRRAWDVLGPVWSRSAELLDRDVERVGVALAHGAGAELIVQLYPYAAVKGDELLLPSHSDTSGRVRVGDRLMLQPMLAPPLSSGWTDDYDDVCLAVRYSVPGSWRAFDDTPPSPASLSALVGPQRAKILRRLDRPATAGDLAELLHGGPSMVTHHLRTLEAAGLVTRIRDGRHVRVRRTARGTELLAMYDRP